MSIWLRVNGYPATEIAAHSPVTWETAADGGSFKASWAFALTMRSQHQALREGAPVELMCGPMPLFSGLLDYPDRTTWECTAYGYASQAQKFLALDGGGATTRDVGVAIAQAIARGWNVTNPQGISGSVSGTAAGNPVSVGQLLDEFAKQNGQRWGVNGRREIYVRPDPTSPMWLSSPGSAAFGVATEGKARRLAGRYLDSGSGTFQTAFAGAGIPEEATDELLSREAMTNAQAVAILNGMLTLGKGGDVWTNGVTLTRDQLTTMGGSRAFLPAVRGGQLTRSFGLAYASNGFALNTVIGKTRYTQGSSSIYLEPVNLAESSTPFAA